MDIGGSFRHELTGSFSQGSDSNPTVAMVEASYKANNLHYRYVNCEVNPDQFIKRGSFRSDYDFRMYDNRKTFLKDLFKLAIEQGSPIEYVIVDGIRKWERTSVWDRGRFVETEDLNKHILDGRLLVKELVQANY